MFVGDRVFVAHSGGLQVGDSVPSSSRMPGPEPAARGDDPDRTAPALASPGLIVLAALAVLEGYRQLHLSPSPQWDPSGYLFAVLAPLAAVALTQTRRGVPRTPALKAVVGAAVVLGAATPGLLVSNRPLAGVLLGAGDLVTAVLILGAVLAAERPIRSSQPGTEAGQAIG